MTESQGRVHTSSATVTVLPDVDVVDVDIDERDLEIDVYRSSGAGGQHVNTTDSAVRITHVPTGVVVTMQDERSQLQNRNRAMQVLRARLFERVEAERAAELSIERRSQVGGGGRSEKIRTYNFKENRLTDHRIGFTVYRLADILGGDLGIVVDALAAEERARLLAEGSNGDGRELTSSPGASCSPRPLLCSTSRHTPGGSARPPRRRHPTSSVHSSTGRRPNERWHTSTRWSPGYVPANRSSTSSAAGRSATSTWPSTNGC